MGESVGNEAMSTSLEDLGKIFQNVFAYALPDPGQKVMEWNEAEKPLKMKSEFFEQCLILPTGKWLPTYPFKHYHLKIPPCQHKRTFSSKRVYGWATYCHSLDHRFSSTVSMYLQNRRTEYV